jgi:hypothetical protein
MPRQRRPHAYDRSLHQTSLMTKKSVRNLDRMSQVLYQEGTSDDQHTIKQVRRHGRKNETPEALVLTLLHFVWNQTSLAIDDLCDVVTDLLIAESKLLNPSLYGVSAHHQVDAASSDSRTRVLNTVKTFVSALPTRYSLGADTPSLVLLHMRLMAVPRADPTKAAVHIQNLDHDPHWRDSDSDHGPGGGAPSIRSVRLVTVACSDRSGLLEFLTRHLSRQKSRVLDADVMTSRDGIALVRACTFPV